MMKATDPLVEALKALAEPNRVDLLLQLNEQRPLEGLYLTPSRESSEAQPGGNGRLLTRESVRRHLAVLAEHDLVRVTPARRADGRVVHHYVTNPSGLFNVVERLAELAHVSSPREPPVVETMPLEAPLKFECPGDRAHFIQLRGLGSPRPFPLSGAGRAKQRGWIIGRAPSATVRLAYDPYVPTEAAEVLHSGDGYSLLDLREAANRTHVDGRELKPGQEVALEHGNIVVVGRSALVFHESTNGHSTNGTSGGVTPPR